jgi:hypothetical protein
MDPWLLDSVCRTVQKLIEDDQGMELHHGEVFNRRADGNTLVENWGSLFWHLQDRAAAWDGGNMNEYCSRARRRAVSDRCGCCAFLRWMRQVFGHIAGRVRGRSMGWLMGNASCFFSRLFQLPTCSFFVALGRGGTEESGVVLMFATLPSLPM